MAAACKTNLDRPTPSKPTVYKQTEYPYGLEIEYPEGQIVWLHFVIPMSDLGFDEALDLLQATLDENPDMFAHLDGHCLWIPPNNEYRDDYIRNSPSIYKEVKYASSPRS